MLKAGAADRTYAWLGISSSTTSRSTDLVTSPVISPPFVACIRLTLAVYTFGTALAVLIHDSGESSKHDAGGFFSYFTDLSLIGLTAYFWAAGIQTLAYTLRGEKTYPLQRWPRFLQFLHRLLYSSITTFPIVTTVTYWALLSGADTFATRYNTWSNISEHLLNTVFALFEILFTHCGPSPWSHLIFLIIFLAGYLGVAYITHATEGFYTYSFLDPHKEGPLLAAFIIGIAVGECIVFSAVWGLCYLREWLSRRLRVGAEATGVRSVQAGTREAIDEWEELERPGTPEFEGV
ncbi:hypothetical protein PILCRDRAFT_826110 [Piloderma croceum F 1598]|uniref:FAR-17a/AIG1-like protein n=1 Tax=Piloderma croceum (strain F 1598) TaxID=765440 RepID=A0A0C3BH92_PILCF|nr:hypothetical protein PILCRDRAFT_826110 [Piloderma croceum F 1598]